MDTLSFSNSSNKNENNLFVALIASFNIVAKTFIKIAKTIVRLSAMSVAIKRRHVLILQLVAKYAKTDYKNEIYKKNWVRSTWTAKSQQLNSRKSMVNRRSKATEDDASKISM